jgi:hypothetical protein
MPWKVERTSSCPAGKPYGVVPTDGSGGVRGCHETRDSAIKQMQALNIKYKNGEISMADWEAEMAWLVSYALDHPPA